MFPRTVWKVRMMSSSYITILPDQSVILEKVMLNEKDILQADPELYINSCTNLQRHYLITASWCKAFSSCVPIKCTKLKCHHKKKQYRYQSVMERLYSHLLVTPDLISYDPADLFLFISLQSPSLPSSHHVAKVTPVNSNWNFLAFILWKPLMENLAIEDNLKSQTENTSNC